MGTELLIFGAVMIIGAAAAYFLTRPPSLKSDRMKPATLDSFNITYCEEGTVVPLVYGKVRRPGNFLWYGNLVTRVSHAKGPGRPVDGYHYYLDMWQGIGIGLLEIVGCYIDNKKKDFTDSYTYDPGSIGVEGVTRVIESGRSITYNPGDSGYRPDEAGDNASAMNPICHAFMKEFHLGFNVGTAPTIHFVVKRRFDHGFRVRHAELSNGSNPAAVIMDILLRAGYLDFDYDKFNAAADYWYNQGYGINMDFSELEEAKSMIQKVFNYVDGVLRKNSLGKWELIAFTDTDAAVGDPFMTEDFIEFSIVRPSWDTVYNHFIGNYTDESAEFTRRTIRVSNPAGVSIVGYRRTKTVDLTAFIDKETASKRLWEIAKRVSYPYMQMQFKTNLKWQDVNVGDVKKIYNTEYGIDGADVRIIGKSIDEINSNTFTFEAEQMLSTLFDGSFEVSGGTQQVTPDYTPTALIHQKIFRLPAAITDFTPQPCYLALAARNNGTEISFQVWISYDGGTSYSYYDTFTVWALKGLLTADYDSSHTSIDDPVGISLDAYREDPEFETLISSDFPTARRYALVNGELMRFQTVSPGSGTTDLVLTRIVRGEYDTDVKSHLSGDEIWLFELSSDNVMEGITANKFHIKLLPSFGDEVVSIEDATAIYYSYSSSSRSSSSESSSSSSSSKGSSSSSSSSSVSSSSKSSSSSSRSYSSSSSSRGSSSSRSSSSSSSSSSKSSSSSSSSSSSKSSSSRSSSSSSRSSSSSSSSRSSSSSSKFSQSSSSSSSSSRSRSSSSSSSSSRSSSSSSSSSSKSSSSSSSKSSSSSSRSSSSSSSKSSSSSSSSRSSSSSSSSSSRSSSSSSSSSSSQIPTGETVIEDILVKEF